MDFIIFILSYILLSTVGSLSYVGILLLFFMMLKKVFHMNEGKWNSVLKYKKGKGLHSLMVFPYLVTLIIMFPLSIFWFDLINFEYRILGSISTVVLLTITGIIKFSKLKGMLQEKYQETF